ncbi:hypothetical protein D3C71_2138530 [compost metagenome]
MGFVQRHEDVLQVRSMHLDEVEEGLQRLVVADVVVVIHGRHFTRRRYPVRLLVEQQILDRIFPHTVDRVLRREDDHLLSV